MTIANENTGVSVILCCYNSANRITETLKALAKQQLNTHVCWELILIDNASTDRTSEISRSVWKGFDTGIELRTILEPVPGLGNARRRGIKEAYYSYILFCDDDTWLAADYVEKVYNILSNDPRIAACGGKGIPVFETVKPFWFDEYAEAFAVGSQAITREQGRILHLYGAGLGISKKIFNRLMEGGFQSILQGRVGNTLSSSEDTELTYAFVLMGYKLHYEDTLKFYHYLPKDRLHFDYLKRLFTAFGSDGPVRNMYYANLSNRFFHKKITNWNYHFILSLFRLFKYYIIPPKKYGRTVYYKWSIAYIKELLSLRTDYIKILNNIFLIKSIHIADDL